MENLTKKDIAKIQRNTEDDQRFINEVDEYLRGNFPTYRTINVCKDANIMKLLNSKSCKIILKQSVLKNALASKNEGHSQHSRGHELGVDIIKELSKQLRNPVLILKGTKNRDNTVIFVTECKDKNNNPVIVPIELDRRNGRVNKVSSMYGRTNMAAFLENNKERVIAVNTEKANTLYNDIGYQLPKLNTVICFDNSIAYTTKNVNYPQENNIRSDEKMEENTIKIEAEVKEIIDKINQKIDGLFTLQQEEEEAIKQYHSIEYNPAKTEQIAEYVMLNGKMPENTDFAIHKGKPVLLQTLLDFNYIAGGDEQQGNINDIVDKAFAQNPDIYAMFADLYPNEADGIMAAEEIINRINQNSEGSFTSQQEEAIKQYHGIEYNPAKTEQIAEYVMLKGKMPENTDFAIHKGKPVLLQSLLDFNYISGGDEKQGNINDIVDKAFAQNPDIYVMFSDLYPNEADGIMAAEEIINRINQNSEGSFTSQQEEAIKQYHGIEYNPAKTEQIAEYVMLKGKMPENTDFAIHKGKPVLLQSLLDFNYISGGDEKQGNINDIVDKAFAQNPDIYVMFSDLYPNEASRATAAETLSNAKTMAQDFIANVVSSMSIPEIPVEMEINPKFGSVFTEKNFKEINEAVNGLSQKIRTDEDISAENEIADVEILNEQSNENTQIQEETAVATEVTNTIIAQHYNDIAQVNADVTNDLETGDISVSQQQEQTENDAELSDDGENDIMLALHKAADEKDANAMNILGVCYMTGMNVAIDEVKALNYFKQATELENVSAMRNLAIVLENNAEPDPKQAAELYSKAADNGDRFAQNNLGVCYLMGDGVEKNVRKAVQYFEKAVKSGDDYAMVNLADCYSIGNGVRKNDKKAFDLYKQAADKGNIAGIKAVADSLYKGIGTKQDFSEAMKFYKMAADRGDEASKAMYEMIQSKTSGQKHDIKSETTIAASKESTKTDKNNAEKVKQHKNREAR